MPHDLVVEDATIVTMDAARTVARGWVAVDDGAISGIGSGPVPPATRRIDAAGGILHPGFVSAHTHTMDTLARAGRGDAQEFFAWLFGTYYGSVLTHGPAEAARAVELAAADLARAGVTTVVDCWGVGDVGGSRAEQCFDASVTAAAESGLRWIIAPMVSDRLPEAWAPVLAAAPAPFRAEALTAPTEVALRFAADALVRERRLVSVWTSVELPEMATDDLLTGLGRLAASRGRGFTTHLCASPAGAVDVTGERAAARLERLGVFAVPALGAHLTATDAADRAVLASAGVGAAHCATSTMLGGGDHSPLGELVAAGVPVGLGLDNATLNATADMGAEMRHALMFDRSCGAGRATAEDVLAHATIDGARAIGLDDRIGSIEIGKRADLVLVDTTGSHWQPDRDPVLGLVWQARADDIRLVLVDGAPVHTR
ncbi:amidohydrolase family protein [Microbacterium sp. SORGH_AS_0888]|uniref:amidohydrolase family protein n=1 Tax=Microbacterium sp. SORGH_AS_0888 TaxID=3041791 RepID=UPI00278241F4|nr:amidohydrolase family protein [Microbacterium sp. SORGH_AS_0888]MDQ1130556.1 5-methylthioadenosine/S-adenosylhomocysteine deaminase [Microbacterium sp. SORGH_AS_0888]